MEVVAEAGDEEEDTDQVRSLHNLYLRLHENILSADQTNTPVFISFSCPNASVLRYLEGKPHQRVRASLKSIHLSNI